MRSSRDFQQVGAYTGPCCKEDGAAGNRCRRCFDRRSGGSLFVVARLSLALLEPADGVAVFWPAAGLASGILIALGPAARWPVVLGVVAATMAANLLGDRNILFLGDLCCRERR